MSDAVFSKEHVLCAAETDAFGSELPCLRGIPRDVGVGADAQSADRINPGHELDQIRIVRLGIKRFELACNYTARGAVEREPIAFLEGVALDAKFLLGFVNGAVACAGNAALAHAAGNNRCVRSHAAARGEDARDRKSTRLNS